MKLLFGFKDVIIPKEEYIHVLTIMEELQISDKNDFKDKTFAEIISRVDETHLFQAYETSFAFTNSKLNEKCLQILKSRNFKDIVDQKELFNTLSETAFINLLEAYYEEKYKSNDPSKYFTSKEIVSVIKDYCQTNSQNEKDHNQNYEFADEIKQLRKQLQDIHEENGVLKENIEKIHTQNQSSQLKLTSIDEKITSIDALSAKTSGIQQQLAVQSNEFNNILQSINQLKTTILLQNDDSPLKQAIPSPKVVLNGNSSILSSVHLEKLQEWIPRLENSSKVQTCRLDLLYKGSSDGYSEKVFHEKCDNQTPTIFVIKSKDFGCVFGGYTEQTWNKNENGRWKEDNRAFIFSLTRNEKYPVAKPDRAIGVFPRNLVKFGEDIAIYLEHISRIRGYCTFPDSYQCAKFNALTNESRTYLAGAYQFDVDEIEVYVLVWI